MLFRVNKTPLFAKETVKFLQRNFCTKNNYTKFFKLKITQTRSWPGPKPIKEKGAREEYKNILKESTKQKMEELRKKLKSS